MDANAWKAKGNEHFSAQRFPEAVEAFGKAIELDGANHVLFSNRSAAYASLKNYEAAKADAEKCVSLKPDWSKGYARLGAALHGLEMYEEAIGAYEQGLGLDATNDTLLSGLKSVQDDAAAAKKSDENASPFSQMFNASTMGKIAANPKLSPFLGEPDYVQKITTIVQNPALAQAFMSDKRIMTTVLILSGIDPDILGGGGAKAEPAAPAPKPAAEKPKPKSADPKKDLPPAMRLKEEGNALYKARDFEGALAKYKAAFAEDPENSTFLLNMTAVYFEQASYEKCIAECDLAVDHARERKDFTVVGKAMTRKASCLQKQGQYEEAMALFKKALLENRNAETLSKMEACEKEMRQKAEEAYFNPELAVKAKDEGNAFFKEDKFPEAVKCYDEAIKRNPKEHTFYSNRAAALLKLCAYEDVIRDCDKCLDIKPDFAKAFARKGHAYFWTKQYSKAVETYSDGLKADPASTECKEGYARAMAKIQEMATGEGDAEAAQRAMADPEIQGILQDSYMQMVLGEMQKDPKRINEYMKDPGISAKVNKLIMAGVLRVGK